jgi:hypothetical protein
MEDIKTPLASIEKDINENRSYLPLNVQLLTKLDITSTGGMVGVTKITKMKYYQTDSYVLYPSPKPISKIIKNYE